jgi:hypothetical protein
MVLKPDKNLLVIKLEQIGLKDVLILKQAIKFYINRKLAL